ncbi:MAG: hypothetical protein RL693_434 [Verrucomicrobiota bacterium]|jgi:hypothetical protein
MKWKAPKDSIVDGAPMPQPFLSIISGPLEGKYRNASIFHDLVCNETEAYREYIKPTKIQSLARGHVCSLRSPNTFFLRIAKLVSMTRHSFFYNSDRCGNI